MKDKNMLILGAIAIVAIIFLVMLFQAQIAGSAIREMPGISSARIGQNTGTQDMYKRFLETQKSVQMPSGPGGGQMLPGMYPGGAAGGGLGQAGSQQQMMMQNRYPYQQTGSQQLQYKALKGSMQRESQELNMRSQMLKTRHDESMAAIRNIR